jgi:hypothetical protein
MAEQRDIKGSSILATSVFFATAVVGVISFLVAFARTPPDGIALIAAALAFGLMTNALMRH